MKNQIEIDMEQLRDKVENLQKHLIQLELDLTSVNQRNARVELDKKWETSITRFVCVVAITYIIMNLILWTIGSPFPPLNAIIPTVGYMLSTLSLKKIKERWIKQPAAKQSI